MMRTLKEFYGTWILIFYFIKWPYFLGYAYLYFAKGLQNWVLIALWLLCLFLILQDFYKIARYGFGCKKEKGCDVKENNFSNEKEEH